MIVHFSPSKLLTYAGSCVALSFMGIPFVYFKATKNLPFNWAIALTVLMCIFATYLICLAFKQWYSALHTSVHPLILTDTGIEINLSPLYSFYKNYFSGFVPFGSIARIELITYHTDDSAVLDVYTQDKNLPARIHLPHVFNPSLITLFPFIQAKRLKQVLKLAPLNISFAVPNYNVGATELSIAAFALILIFIFAQDSSISVPVALLSACIVLATTYSVYCLRKRAHRARSTTVTALVITDQGIDFVSPLSNIYSFQGFVPWHAITQTELSARRDISKILTLHFLQENTSTQSTETIIIPDKLDCYLEVLAALSAEYTTHLH